MNELPEPPKPDTHCWDDDERVDVWSYSAYQLNEYGAECYRKALEDAARMCDEMVKSDALVQIEKYRAGYIADAIREMKP